MSTTKHDQHMELLEGAIHERCQRPVRILARPPRPTASSSEATATSLQVEVPLLGLVWLAIRLELTHDTVSVPSIAAWADPASSATLVESTVPPVEPPRPGAKDANDPNALAELLTETIDAARQRFRAAQAQLVLTAAAPRVKFEFELLQHYEGLELVVLRDAIAGHRTARLHIPLIGPSEPVTTSPTPLEPDDERPRDILATFALPTAGDAWVPPVVAVSLALDDPATPWDASIHWPPELTLTPQLVELPDHHAVASAMDAITQARESYLRQWRRRRDFIMSMRKSLTVLEFEPVDFAHVVLLVQDQPASHLPWMLVIVKLEFTAEYFLTNCIGDLRITLLDGEGGSRPTELKLQDVVLQVDSVGHVAADYESTSVADVLRESLRRYCLSS